MKSTLSKGLLGESGMYVAFIQLVAILWNTFS